MFVHPPDNLRGRELAERSGVEIRRMDLDDAFSIAENSRDCEAALYLVHSMSSAGPEYATWDGYLASLHNFVFRGMLHGIRLEAHDRVGRSEAPAPEEHHHV